MKLLIVVVSCAVGAFANDPGIRANNAFISDDDVEGRIINGRLANRGNFPWQVGIFFTVGKSQQFCGGALISNEWVLTAGHCVYNASSFELILGATRAYDSEPGKITMRASRALYHPRYNPSTLNNDVAVIKLEQPVTFNRQIQKITLAKSNTYLQGGVAVQVSGWGKTNDRQSGVVNELSWVNLNTITNDQCKRDFRAELIQDNVVCCDGSQIKSTCSGDSGGPLIQCNNNVCIHVGIVSFVSTEGCAVGKPSGYIRTAQVIGFINANTGLNFS